MHLSGILVVTRPGETGACERALAALPGVEVRTADRQLGRLVVLQETDTLEAQEEGLRRIQDLAPVRFAALVEHCFERGTEAGPQEGDST